GWSLPLQPTGGRPPPGRTASGGLYPPRPRELSGFPAVRKIRSIMNEESHAAHAAHRERNLPPVAPPGVRQLCLALLIVMTSAHAFYGAASVGNRAADFEYFYKASRWLLEHGNIDARYDLLPDGTRVPRGGIEWYLPFVPRVYTAISWMPMRLAGTLWLLTNIVVFFGILRLLGRY